jgi:hypothetical protein
LIYNILYYLILLISIWIANKALPFILKLCKLTDLRALFAKKSIRITFLLALGYLLSLPFHEFVQALQDWINQLTQIPGQCYPVEINFCTFEISYMTPLQELAH